MPKSLIISYKNPIRANWDLAPMILSTYNAIIIPLELSFGLPFFYLRINEIIDIALDFLFMIDNILMFFTTY
jgi:hypothetical protein